MKDWLTEEQIATMSKSDMKAYIKARLSDQWWRLNNLYYITDKSGRKVLFRMNAAQRFLFSHLWFFNIILKARQLGFSTAIQIFILDSALFNADLECGVIAQGRDQARKIFRTKILYPYKNLPDWLKRTIPSVRLNSDEIEFDNGSTITVSTSFRSGTLNILHVSEFAKICAEREDKAEEVMSGTLNAVHPGNIAFIESTAEGAAGHYFDLCQEAKELLDAGIPLTDIDFKFFFFPWWDEPTYTMPVPERGLLLTKVQYKYFTSLEKALGKKIPDERKAWYIAKERQQKTKMKQEFPSTPEEAFLTSGRKVFENDDLMVAKGGVKRPLLIYDINVTSGVRKIANRKVDMTQVQRSYTDKTSKATTGYLLVWEVPQKDEQYVIGADVAEGLEHGDNSSFDILHKDTGIQVAHWFGKIPPKKFADLIKHVGEWYNYSYVGVERNNHGHAVLDRLRAVYPMKHIYFEEYMDREDDDEETKRIGWQTSAVSKEILISDMEDLLENEKSGIRWTGTVSEFYTYVRDERGRANAMSGSKDDQVMSYMIAQQMRSKAPKRIKRSDETTTKQTNWMAR